VNTPGPHHGDDDLDPAEAIVDVIPWVIPLAGAGLMFLMSFIAVFVS